MGSGSHDILVTAVAAVSGGTLLLVLARRLNIPAIVLLLLGGAVFGPQGVGLIDPDSFGEGLLVLVELSVGLILFEGGLTLRPQGYRTAPAMIKRLLTLGVLVTWLATTLLIRFIVGTSWQQAIIAASLVIVTGPTVIAPLLKRIRVRDRLHSILNWEAVLIDPIGVFVAVLCFEWLGEQTGPAALINLGVRAGIGLGLGLAGGVVMLAAVRRKLVPPDLINVFTLAGAVLIFGLAEAIMSKSGLLAVTVAGFSFGFAAREDLKDVRRFKAELTDLLIATLFMLLAARLQIEQFGEFGWRGVLAVAAVLFLVRPLCIAVCGWGLDLTAQERAFLSWIAPRGIVAASMASLFAISLEQREVADARFVETFTYSVIVATILLQGLTAGPVARMLRLRRPEPTGWLIVGAHLFARRVASFIRETTGSTVVLVDTSAGMVRDARDAGFEAVRADARDVEIADKHQLLDVGHVLALTDNEDLNARVCTLWSEIVGRDNVYRYRLGGQHGSSVERGAAGRNVWPSLPRPGVLSNEIASDTTEVIEVVQGAERPRPATLLASFDGKHLHLGGTDAASDERATGRALLIRRDTDSLQRSLRPGLVLLVDEPRPLEELLDQMMQRLGDICPDLADEDILPKLMERERTFPSVIGEGVAVPHTYSDRSHEQFCAIARMRESVDYPDAGGEPVRLMFLLVSPRSDPKAHLTLLADIARLVENSDVRTALMEADSVGDLLTIVHERRRRPKT